MTNIEKILISFGAGLGVGLLGGKVYYEKKYRMKLNGATFNSDKKAAAEEKVEEKAEDKNPKESSELNKNKEDLSSMAQKVKEENPRVDYSTPTPGEKKHEVEQESVLAEDFVLEPDDFGELADEDYEVVTVLYLADGHLVYENGKAFDPMEEPQKKIGSEALRILRNNPASDVVYVRNNRTKIDYEIILDDRTLNEGASDDEDDEN